MTQPRINALAISLGLVASLLTACGAVGNVKDGAVAFAKEGIGIRERSAAREIILDLNPDATSLPMMMAMVEPIIADAASDGAYVEIWVVTGGVAAAMAPVDLEVAQGGDMLPTGKNAAAWAEEARQNKQAVLEATRIALTEQTRGDTGADLSGALSIAAQRATELPGSGNPEVILISNGIHRTVEVDLQKVDFSTTDPAEVASTMDPLDAPDVALQIIGAGRFPNVNPPPDAVWAAGIRDTWEAFCAASNTKSCTVRDRPTRQEG